MTPRLIATLLLVFPATSAAQLIVAHRGASYDAPENTLAAFNLAWEQGADAIEGDFHLTADGKIVCHHDYDTAWTGGEKLVAKDSTLAQLQALDVGAWKGQKWRGERAPTLGDVAATVPEGKLFFVEVKCGPEIVAPMIKVLGASGLEDDQIVVISFRDDVIAACEAVAPEYRTQWLTGYKEQTDGSWSPNPEEVAAKLSACHADGFGSQAQRAWLDEHFLKQLANRGHRAFGVWTVDDLATARSYQKLGAWSITTNRPGWLRAQLGE